MIILIAVLIALLPFLIACIRNPGWFASIIVAVCTIPVIVLALVGEWSLAVMPWVISLLVACASTGGRERAERKRHADLMKALADKDERKPDAVDLLARSGR